VIAADLLAWYDRHARALPWRSPPGAPPPDPYRVWLSEIMLQQTTVMAVKPYFERFTTRWPTVADLAATADAELMAAWAGLGYYARARNLLACARAVVNDHGGRFPDSEDGLRALPGVGPYTAAAIAAIAFDRPAAVVDGNVERVIARLFAIATPLPAAKPEIRARAAELTPDRRPGDYAQAMMDLGATICTPRRPACALCPVRAHCIAAARGEADLYPVKAPKAAKPHRLGLAFWAEAEGHVLLVTRPAKGLLAGMRALPTGAWTSTPGGLAEAPFAAAWEVLPRPVEHVFTHFSLDLSVAVARLEKRCAPPPAAEWWPLDRLDAAGLPTLFRKAAELATGRNDVRTAA
jgi:A/G-specific adenine glycosylase